MFSNGRYLQFRDVPNEPRFTIKSPLPLSVQFRNRYTPEELSDRADVDFTTLPDDQQQAAVESVLNSDLETSRGHETEFKNALHEDVLPADADILRLTYGDENLWNGVIVRDRLFPYNDSFGIPEYRTTVTRVRQLTREVNQLLVDTVPPLHDGHTEDSFSNEPGTFTGDAIGFQ